MGVQCKIVNESTKASVMSMSATRWRPAPFYMVLILGVESWASVKKLLELEFLFMHCANILEMSTYNYVNKCFYCKSL